MQSERVGARTRQSTWLNSGRHFAVEPAHWPTLRARVEDNLRGQSVLVAVECSLAVEREAQRIAARLPARRGVLESPGIRNAAQAGNADGAQASIPDIQSVDVDSLELHRPRSVGVEPVGLRAMRQSGLVELLQEVGLHGAQRGAIIGSLSARPAAPGSELAAHRWPGSQSGSGEWLDADYEAMP